MFLKSMELMGFKSFADRTHIDFSSGISALLGPNGCGKSNIVDAVKWVLGEQSTKNMRAMKMEDVIFNGTVKRKALNVAEVTLIISNEENLLEIDAPEISIKRRLYRTGESEYFINNTSVRLKELRELFFDTGIGKTAYSILEQGKIDQILSNRPEERRYLFEEAAGITKFKVKAQEAERKLIKTRENIKQASNILNEVSRSYFTLKEQSEKTTEYRKIRDDLFNIEVNHQKLKIIKLNQLHERRDEEQEKKRKSLNNLSNEIDSINRGLEESDREGEKLKNLLSETNKGLYSAKGEKDSITYKIKNLKERSLDYNEQLEALSGKEKKYLERVVEIKSSIDTQDKSLIESKKGEESLNSQLEERVRESKELDLALISESEKLKEYKEKIAFKSSELESVLSELGEISGKIASRVQDILIKWDYKKNLTLIDLFREKLKKALKNPQLLYNLTDDFNEIVDNFPEFHKLLEDDGDISNKGKLDKRITDIKKSLSTNRENQTRSETQIETLGQKISLNSELISRCKIELAEVKVKITGLNDQINILKRNLEEENSLLKDVTKEKIVLNDRIKQLNLDREGLKKSKDELDKKEAGFKAELERLNKLQVKHSSALDSKKEEMVKKREKLNSLTLQVERYNIESEHLDSKVKELYEEFRENHSVELDEACEELDGFIESEAELKEKLLNLKNRQKSLGQINLMAPEEFEEVSKRYNFLKDQIDDLKKADENLTHVTQGIKEESTRLFFETFENIKKSFSVMYQKLFGGGFAELKLTDDKNILESGIEIYARPPGKSLENISLLSGGERSLTAVALLFATYSIKPSPFCILDEIDAALDERNISRFVTTLTDFSKESQFIVITHNKKTVTGAGTLLGVTMEESGVSKLITMRLDSEE